MEFLQIKSAFDFEPDLDRFENVENVRNWSFTQLLILLVRQLLEQLSTFSVIVLVAITDEIHRVDSSLVNQVLVAVTRLGIACAGILPGIFHAFDPLVIFAAERKRVELIASKMNATYTYQQMIGIRLFTLITFRVLAKSLIMEDQHFLVSGFAALPHPDQETNSFLFLPFFAQYGLF